jgi:hypothetical protein
MNNIDASIALQAGQGIPQFDPMGAAQKGMNLQRTILENANLPTKLANENAASQVATARAQQELEQQKRENATRVRAAEIAKLYTTKDADGNRVIDHSGVANQLSEEGQDPGIIFGYQQKAIENQRGKFDNATVVKNLTDSITTTHDNMMRVAKSPQQALGIMRSTHDLLLPVLGEAGTKQFLSNRYGGDNLQGVDPNNPSVQAQVAKHFVDTSEGYAKARSISPQQEIANKQAQEGLDQGGASGGVGPNERNNTSPQSRELQDGYIRANPDLTPEQQARVRTLSAAFLRNNPTIQQIMGSITPSAGERAQAVGAAGDLASQKGVIDQGVSAIDEGMGTKYGKPGSVTRAVWNRLIAQDPKYAAIQSAIDKHNANNPNSKLDILDGLDAVKRQLDVESGRLGKKATTQVGIAGSGNLSKTAKDVTSPSPLYYKDANGRRLDLNKNGVKTPAEVAELVKKHNLTKE